MLDMGDVEAKGFPALEMTITLTPDAVAEMFQAVVNDQPATLARKAFDAVCVRHAICPYKTLQAMGHLRITQVRMISADSEGVTFYVRLD